MGIELKGIKNLDDKSRMEELINYIKIQADDESDPIALMSNISAFIMAIIKDLNWAGFYIVKEDELYLGPFQGLPACTRLSFDKGVCAKAYKEEKMIKVDNVNEFEGHVVCDNNSLSELVVPIFNEGKLVCLIDLDSPSLSRFTNLEVEGFEEIANILDGKIKL